MTKAPDWDRYATLHKVEDGGGVLERAKSLRSGSLAELVAFVAKLPEAEARHYFIVKEGERRIDAAEILDLARRDDFPG